MRKPGGRREEQTHRMSSTRIDGCWSDGSSMRAEGGAFIVSRGPPLLKALWWQTERGARKLLVQ